MLPPSVLRALNLQSSWPMCPESLAFLQVAWPHFPQAMLTF